MKTPITSLLSALFISLGINAQTNPFSGNDIPELQKELNTLFSKIDTEEISSGILSNKGMRFNAVKDFSSANSTMTGDQFLELYSQMYYGRVNESVEFALPKELLSISQIDRQNNIHDIEIMAFEYQRFSDSIDSLTFDNYFTFDSTTKVLYDNSERPNSPYVTDTIFGATCLSKHLFGPVKFNFPVELFNSNIFPTLPIIKVNFGNGLGEQDIVIGTTYSVGYSQVGNKLISVSAKFNGVTLTSRFEIEVVDVEENAQNNINILSSQGVSLTENDKSGSYSIHDEVWYDQQSDARGYIYYSWDNPTKVLSKPIIFVEGIDPEDDFGSDYFYYLISESHNFENSWHRLYSDLKGSGYDIIYLDFTGSGTDYIQNNSKILQRLISDVNSTKESNPEQTFPNVLVGVSMGGVIARHALSTMEKNIPCTPHDTRLYVSYDAPQNGAETPMSIQYLAKEMYEYIGFFSKEIRNMYKYATSPAAKQLLKGHFLNSGNAHSLHSDLFDELETLGYPKYSRNVALSLGNPFNCNFPSIDYPSSKYKSYAQGGQTLHARKNPWYGFGVRYNIKMYSSSMNNNNTVLDFSMNGKLYWIRIAQRNNTYKHKANRYTEATSGGFIPFFEEVHNVFDGIYSGSVTYPNEGTGWATHIPFYSSIDMKGNFHAQKYVNLTLTDIESQDLTPFDKIYVQSSNYQSEHVLRIPSETHQQFLTELNITSSIGPGAPIELSTTYNIYNPNIVYAPVTINSGGVLQVNHSGPVEYNNGAAVNRDNQIDVHVEDFPCREFIVKDGGKLSIGDASGNYHANMYISSAKIKVEEGGEIEINNNSRLIIETESDLEYIKNAKINLVGTNSVLEIKGTLTLGELAVFDFSGNGYISFNSPNYPYETVKFGPNSGIQIIGRGRGHKSIEILQPQLRLMDQGFLTLKHTDVSLGAGSSLNPACPTNLLNVEFSSGSASNNGHNGLTIYGQPVNIKACHFKNGNRGIDALLLYKGSPLNISNCKFDNLNIAIHQWGAGMTVSNSSFSGNLKDIFSEASYFPLALSNNSFENGTYGVDIVNSSLSPLEAYKNTFNNVDHSVSLIGGATNSFSCNTFNDFEDGIYINGGALNMSTIFGHGNNLFSSGDHAIYLQGAYEIDMDNGFNDLLGDMNDLTSFVSPGQALIGDIRPYPNNTMYANSNRWPSAKYYNNIPKYLVNYRVDQISGSNPNVNMGPLTVVDDAPVGGVGPCPKSPICVKNGFDFNDASLRTVDANHEADCSTNPINVCEDCGLVIAKGLTLQFNSALNLYLADLRNAESLQDSIDVMHGLAEIIAQPQLLLTPEETYLLRKSYAIMMTLFAVNEYEQIKLNNDAGNILSVQLIMKAIDNLELLATFAGYEIIPGFELSVSRSQLINFTTNRQASANYLYSVRDQYDDADKDKINYWICIFETEMEYLQNEEYDITNIPSCYHHLQSQPAQNRVMNLDNEKDQNVHSEKIFEFFPNPTQSSFTLTTSIDGKMNVINILGEIFYSADISSGNSIHDISSLPPGIYTLTISNNKESVSEILIKD